MKKSELQIRREESGLSISELAYKASKMGDVGSVGHLELTIQFIETGVLMCPKPRKTYEYKVLARALKCKVEDIWARLETKCRREGVTA
ncbi:hypothetical protein [Listeria booriae]|uniref:HTH cro/C1-type domain-containing protein n=1 Tax=Listeria booriae TaxID=1552123 RepID=A0A842FC78_9LIST|nr:hypothetical protein [Listeria booriae]MBC2242249.1 hypothetical protein [Listeria booriae]